MIHAINSAVKSVRGEEREFILEDADDVVCSVRALYSNLNSQMRMQITQPARDMKYADRFFFRDEDGAVDLIEQFPGNCKNCPVPSRSLAAGIIAEVTVHLAPTSWTPLHSHSKNWRQILTGSYCGWNAEARPRICLSAPKTPKTF